MRVSATFYTEDGIEFIASGSVSSTVNDSRGGYTDKVCFVSDITLDYVEDEMPGDKEKAICWMGNNDGDIETTLIEAYDEH